jgi:hypothetical protein
MCWNFAGAPQIDYRIERILEERSTPPITGCYTINIKELHLNFNQSVPKMEAGSRLSLSKRKRLERKRRPQENSSNSKSTKKTCSIGIDENLSKDDTSHINNNSKRQHETNNIAVEVVELLSSDEEDEPQNKLNLISSDNCHVDDAAMQVSNGTNMPSQCGLCNNGDIQQRQIKESLTTQNSHFQTCYTNIDAFI